MGGGAWRGEGMGWRGGGEEREGDREAGRARDQAVGE